MYSVIQSHVQKGVLNTDSLHFNNLTKQIQFSCQQFYVKYTGVCIYKALQQPEQI